MFLAACAIVAALVIAIVALIGPGHAGQRGKRGRMGQVGGEGATGSAGAAGATGTSPFISCLVALGPGQTLTPGRSAVVLTPTLINDGWTMTGTNFMPPAPGLYEVTYTLSVNRTNAGAGSFTQLIADFNTSASTNPGGQTVVAADNIPAPTRTNLVGTTFVQLGSTDSIGVSVLDIDPGAGTWVITPNPTFTAHFLRR